MRKRKERKMIIKKRKERKMIIKIPNINSN